LRRLVVPGDTEIKFLYILLFRAILFAFLFTLVTILKLFPRVPDGFYKHFCMELLVTSTDNEYDHLGDGYNYRKFVGWIFIINSCL
jgi:hypothetical protein